MKNSYINFVFFGVSAVSPAGTRAAQHEVLKKFAAYISCFTIKTNRINLRHEYP